MSKNICISTLNKYYVNKRKTKFYIKPPVNLIIKQVPP